MPERRRLPPLRAGADQAPDATATKKDGSAGHLFRHRQHDAVAFDVGNRGRSDWAGLASSAGRGLEDRGPRSRCAGEFGSSNAVRFVERSEAARGTHSAPSGWTARAHLQPGAWDPAAYSGGEREDAG